MTAINCSDISGLVLAGGQGSRMGGQDKGLLIHGGESLAKQVLRRLAPQVAHVLISANRNVQAYAELAAPYGGEVCPDTLPDYPDTLPDYPDTLPDYPGPLAGILAGLQRCPTPYLAVVPCDVPHLPADLVARLARQLCATRSPAALAVAGGRRQPAVCLLSRSLADDLAAYLSSGHRKLDGCLARWQASEVFFEDACAFRNFNTPEQLNA